MIWWYAEESGRLWLSACQGNGPDEDERDMLLPGNQQPHATHARYQPEHIMRVLRGESQRLPTGIERERVSEAIGRFTSSIEHDRLRREFAGMERYVDRLPRILFLYSHGYSIHDIADRLTGLPTVFGVERTIEIAASLVAKQLNG